MYSIADYGRMIADSGRMDAYAEALRQKVNPNSVVLDIGAGTGILSLLACQFGARKVYAIEPEDAIQVAREIAAANGYADRIEFIQDVSAKVTLPERVDIIVSDLRGALPPTPYHIPSIVDARKRHLAPGGVLIPQQDTMWAAVAEAPKIYDGRYTAPWEDNKYGLDMQAAWQVVINTWHNVRLTPEDLLVEPQCWATLDYTVIESANISAEVDWIMARAGMGHGLVIWFDAVLTEGIGFSNAPGKPELIYGSAFFPWLRPVALAVGDRVSVSLKANLVGDSYIWGWSTRVLGRDEQVKAQFQQSTFSGVPASPAQLHKRFSTYVPKMNEKAQIDLFILELMNGETSSGDIARRVSEQFPTRFANWEEALTRVGELSMKYSQ